MRTSKISQKDIALEGMMIALVFLGTFYFKIPTAFGYTHLGDCMIILATCLLGTKKGAIAGAFGAASGAGAACVETGAAKESVRD